MGQYTLKEDGTNGRVEVRPDEIVRTHVKRLGRDEEVRIPMRTVTEVDHDRQVGGDVVRVRTGDALYEWKLDDGDAERLTAEIRSHVSR